MSGKHKPRGHTRIHRKKPRRGLFAWFHRLASAASLLGLSPSKRFRS